MKVPEVKIGKITQIKIDLVLHDYNGQQIHQTKQCAEFVKKEI